MLLLEMQSRQQHSAGTGTSMTMAALMESAILLGRDASVNLGVKTATVAAAHSGLPDSGDWLIVSVAEAEAPEDATTASKTSQASVPNTALPSPMAAIAVPSDGAVAASITAGTLKTSTLELGVPVSTKKVRVSALTTRGHDALQRGICPRAVRDISHIPAEWC